MHAELSARAARNGQSLQEHLRSRLIDIARRPDAKELMAQISERKERTGTQLSAAKILKYRDQGRR
jgi:hypothetical protein